MPLPIPDKTKWQGYKKQFGIPDGLSRVKMGDSFQTYRTTEAALSGKKDYDGNLKAIEKLVLAMSQYAVDLKKTVPDKFGGKTLTEKHASYNKANETFKEIFATVSALKSNYFKLARPLDGVREALVKAQTKFRNLSATSSEDACSAFYKEEFRGINLPLQELERVNKDSTIKTGIQAFKTQANFLNGMLNTSGAFNGADFHSHAATALTTLSAAVARH